MAVDLQFDKSKFCDGKTLNAFGPTRGQSFQEFLTKTIRNYEKRTKIVLPSTFHVPIEQFSEEYMSDYFDKCDVNTEDRPDFKAPEEKESSNRLHDVQQQLEGIEKIKVTKSKVGGISLKNTSTSKAFFKQSLTDDTFKSDLESVLKQVDEYNAEQFIEDFILYSSPPTDDNELSYDPDRAKTFWSDRTSGWSNPVKDWFLKEYLQCSISSIEKKSQIAYTAAMGWCFAGGPADDSFKIAEDKIDKSLNQREAILDNLDKQRGKGRRSELEENLKEKIESDSELDSMLDELESETPKTTIVETKTTDERPYGIDDENEDIDTIEDIESDEPDFEESSPAPTPVKSEEKSFLSVISNYLGKELGTKPLTNMPTITNRLVKFAELNKCVYDIKDFATFTTIPSTSALRRTQFNSIVSIVESNSKGNRLCRDLRPLKG